jgi:hypothetical protein
MKGLKYFWNSFYLVHIDTDKKNSRNLIQIHFSDIEVKSCKEISPSVIKAAAKQSSKRKEKFMKQHQDILSSDWTFVSAVATPMSTYPEKRTNCNYCRRFILDQGTLSSTEKLQQWLDMVTSLAPRQDFEVHHEYRNLLTRIIGFLLISPSLPDLHKNIIKHHKPGRNQMIDEQNYEAIVGPLPVDRSSVEHPFMEDVTAMEALSQEDLSHADAKKEKRKNKVRTHLGSVQTAIIWNKQQLDVLQGDTKKVVFTSDFGTGKTLLLKTKALALANKLRKQKEKEQVQVNEKWPGEQKKEEQALVLENMPLQEENNSKGQGEKEHIQKPVKKSGEQLDEEQVFFVSFAGYWVLPVCFIDKNTVFTVFKCL